MFFYCLCSSLIFVLLFLVLIINLTAFQTFRTGVFVCVSQLKMLEFLVQRQQRTLRKLVGRTPLLCFFISVRIIAFIPLCLQHQQQRHASCCLTTLDNVYIKLKCTVSFINMLVIRCFALCKSVICMLVTVTCFILFIFFTKKMTCNEYASSFDKA